MNVYLLLGIPGSGRFSAVEDLIKGSPDDSETAICHHSDESPSESLTSLCSEALTWDSLEAFKQLELPSDCEQLFFIATAKVNPIDQIEAFKALLDKHELELSRIITVVHCSATAQNKKLEKWYRVLVYFSDVVILANRIQSDDAWLKEFKEFFEKEFYPCLFEMTKKGRLKNPYAVLEPSPRRLSHYFDESDAIDDLEIDPNNLPEEPFDLETKDDPYMRRLPSGMREKPLPDISELLS